MTVGNTLLIVDDNEDNRDVLHGLLETEGYHFLFADNGFAALEQLQQHKIDLVLLDVMMPEMDGFEACRKIRETPDLADVPVVMVTALNDKHSRLKGIEAGADDFISKPFDENELCARVRSITRLNRYRRILEHADHIAYLESYDQLTNLPNREQFITKLGQALNAEDFAKINLAVLCIGLDLFEIINDTLGHVTGDQVLKEVANRLTSCVGPDNLVCRLDSDKFMVLQDAISTPARDATILAQRIRFALRQSMMIGQQEVFLSASIGISLALNDSDDAETLIAHATTAMKRAKKQGKDNQQFFADTMNMIALRQLTFESRLRKALEQEEFSLQYQPKIDLSSGQIVSAEAMLTWNHPEQGLFTADKFIDVAETAGLMEPLGEWLLRCVCQQINLWQLHNLPAIPIAVNIINEQFKNGRLLKSICANLAENELPGDVLELQLTEAVLMPKKASDNQRIVEELTQFKALGVRLIIDDFGSGYSSLSHLTRLPADAVKINREFINKIFNSEQDATLTRTIIHLAHQLNLAIIADGIHTPEQYQRLLDWQCDQAQGHLVSPPLTPQAFAALWHDTNGVLNLPAKATPIPVTQAAL